ncbi:MAG: hypothetical protein WDZ52_03900 [Pseudohongiellaceae bacterium]
MQYLTNAFFGRFIRALARLFQGSRFLHKQGGLGYWLNLLYEKYRPRLRQSFDTLAQGLYNRPSLAGEHHISLLLRLPLHETQILLAKNRLHNSRFEHRRTTVDDKTIVRRYCRAFQLPQREDYLELVRSDGRSRIIASFHCGDFLYGSARLFELDAATRRKYVLSLNKSTPACYANLLAGFGPAAPGAECELLLSDSTSSTLSQLLRAGNTSLLLFCDLPPGLTEVTRIRFLNRYAWFSVGPAILALTNSVPLLPLINYFDGKVSHVSLGRQLEPMLIGSETLRQGANRLTQELVSLFEAVFLKYPEQWRFVSLLPLYFSKPNRGSAEPIHS